MNKSLLFILCLSLAFYNIAQNVEFEQILPLPPAPQIIIDFDRIDNSSIAFADIDGDNDQDVLITGYNPSFQTIAKLYQNDGSGNFYEVIGTPFEGVFHSSIAFADVDGDGDQDVLITGENSSGQRIAKLYQNDGVGNFYEVIGAPFEGVFHSSIAFADIDGDNDQDILITGENTSNQPISKLYQNDGTGNFSEVTGTPFEGVFHSSIAFADIDGDNDQDLLITGYNPSFQTIAKLYQNDGAGNFSEVIGTPFEEVEQSSIAFADIDGDNDQDVLLTGRNASNQRIAILYKNNGTGNFSEVIGTPFEGVFHSSIAFADIDGDNDQDVLITGRNDSNQPISKLYQNDGAGSFTEVTGSPFDGVRQSSIAFADVDGDNDQDVLLTGQNTSNQPISILYQNDGAGNFSEVIGTPFEGVYRSSIAFADIDGDNDQDVLITGYNPSFQTIAKLYQNDGAGNFSEVIGTPFEEVEQSSIAFADIDGDNDPDVLITGRNASNQRIAILYKNNGTGNFSEVIGTPFEGVFHSSIAFADIDGDNDQDVLITGRDASNQPISILYQNDGTGIFTEVTGTPFDQVQFSCIEFADIDGDNDQDILITGENASFQSISKLYQNDGAGNFSEVIGTPFDGIEFSSIAFTDADGDNDQDVIITGYNASNLRIAKLYQNDGTGSFSEVIGTPFDGVEFSSIDLTDIDGDNDQDLLITGYNTSNLNIAKLYRNISCVPSPIDVYTTGPTITTSNSNGTYKWLDCDDNYSLIAGETNNSYTATVNGNYAVEITENGCVDTSLCVSIQNVSLTENDAIAFNIYPNPTTGIFIIASETNLIGSSIKITDAKGQSIQEIKTVSNNSIQIDLSNYQTGIYFIHIQDNFNSANYRIMKN